MDVAEKKVGDVLVFGQYKGMFDFFRDCCFVQLSSRTPPSRTGSSLKILLLLGTPGLPVDNAANSVGNYSCWQKAIIAISASMRSSSETFWFPSVVANACISQYASSGAPLALVFAS